MAVLKRLDANESAYFVEQLTYFEKTAHNTKYKGIRYQQFIPTSTEVPSGTRNITYQVYTAIGLAKIISNYAKDFPRVDLYGEEKTKKVKDLGASFGYNIKEIREQSLLNAGRKRGAPTINLNTERVKNAKRAIDQQHNEIAWFGNDKHGLNGFVNFPGISEYIIPVGASGFKAWSTKTPDEILTDLNGMVTAIIESTNGVEQPNQIILPIAQYRLISTTRLPDGDNATVLKFFLETNPGMSVDWATEVDGAGVDGADRAMCYSRDIMNLKYDAPVLYEQFEAERENMEYSVAVHGESGGVSVYYPASIEFADGI